MSTASTPSSISECIYDGTGTPRQSDHFETPTHEFRTPAPSEMPSTSELLLCSACGTQFDVEDRRLLKNCRICDDPRQFVPRTGQAFTTLGELRKGEYKNKWEILDGDDRFWSIWTEPKFGIGQRAILIRTPHGNVLWDCITLIDEETEVWINGMGGLSAIVISHPHYYTTHLEWAQTFDCPVYLAWEDKQWLNRLDPLGKARTFIESRAEELELHGQKTSLTILKVGGHFPGSLVLLAYGRLLIADSLLTTPAGLGDWSVIPHPAPESLPDEKEKEDGNTPTAVLLGGLSLNERRPVGMNTYSFMYSIPNMIPLRPAQIVKMWDVLKDYEFTSTHGAFVGVDVCDGYGGSKRSVKGRVLDSMQIQVRGMGWDEHDFLAVLWEGRK